jgi:uncharacterized protein YwqG
MQNKDIEQLESMMLPLLVKASAIEVLEEGLQPADSHLKSHVGGQPYFEEGEEWVQTESGKNLDFIFQVFNNGEVELPDNISLVQFYYDWDESPYETEQEGWQVKIYETLNPIHAIVLPKPEGLKESRYCEIKTSTIQSLPDWDGLDVYGPAIKNLCTTINEDDPFTTYKETAMKLSADIINKSKLGGYPNWIQYNDTPMLPDKHPMKMLFQLISEKNAGLEWGDYGILYIFYDEVSKKIELRSQQ